MTWRDEVKSAFADLLDEFGVDVSIHGTSGRVLYEQPGKVVLGGMQLSSDYAIEYDPDHFVPIAYGQSVTVAGKVFSVREDGPSDDGFTRRAVLNLE